MKLYGSPTPTIYFTMYSTNFLSFVYCTATKTLHLVKVCTSLTTVLHSYTPTHNTMSKNRTTSNPILQSTPDIANTTSNPVSRVLAPVLLPLTLWVQIQTPFQEYIITYSNSRCKSGNYWVNMISFLFYRQMYCSKEMLSKGTFYGRSQGYIFM